MTLGDAMMILKEAEHKTIGEYSDYELKAHIALESYDVSCLSWRESLANAERQMKDRIKAIKLFHVDESV